MEKGKLKVLNDYIDFKRTSVTTENKIKDIKRDIERFLNSSDKPLSKFKEPELVKYLNSINHFSVGYINGVKALLKNFLKWNYVDYPARFRNLDRLCRTSKPEPTYKADDMLNEKEINKLANAETDLMWKVYWFVFFYGAFRPSECCRLKWENVEFEKNGAIIKVYLTKNKKDFYKSIPQNVAELMKKWKEHNSSEWIFPSPLIEGKPIQSKTVYFRLIKLSQRVLGKKVVPYAIRHSVGTIKYNSDIKDDIVASQMGHTKDMRDVYVNLDENGLKENARKIWGKEDDLPKKKKDEYEARISKLENRLDKIAEQLTFILNKKEIKLKK